MTKQDLPSIGQIAHCWNDDDDYCALRHPSIGKLRATFEFNEIEAEVDIVLSVLTEQGFDIYQVERDRDI